MHNLGDTRLYLFNINFFVFQVKNQTKSKKVNIKPKSDQKRKLVKRTKLKTQPTATTSKKGDSVPDELKWMQEDPHDQLLSRFVETPKGTRVGESIGIENKKMILKNKSNFYIIPLSYVKEKDDKLELVHKVNWDRAGKLGEHWRKNALDPLYISKKKQKKAMQKKPQKKQIKKTQLKSQKPQQKTQSRKKPGTKQEPQDKLQVAKTKPPKQVKKIAKTSPKKPTKKGAK